MPELEAGESGEVTSAVDDSKHVDFVVSPAVITSRASLLPASTVGAQRFSAVILSKADRIRSSSLAVRQYIVDKGQDALDKLTETKTVPVEYSQIVSQEEDLYLITRSRGNAKTDVPEDYNDQLQNDAAAADHKTAKDDSSPRKDKLAQSKRRIFVYGSILLASGVIGFFYSKKTTIAFINYPFFLNQFITFCFLPVFGLVCLYKYKVSHSITDEMLKFPQRKFAVMGILDATANFMALFGSVGTSGSYQNLLAQAVIIFTMILAYFYLKERYRTNQYIGVVVVLGGILLAIIPQLLGGGSDGNLPTFNILFLLSGIPASMSAVYKEKAFDVDLEGNYLQFYNALWQFFLGFLLAPLNALPILGSSQIPLEQIFPSCWSGLKCLAGINSITTNCTVDGSDPTLSYCDACGGSWVPMTLGILCSLIANVYYVLIIKHGGANILNLIGTLSLPLIQASFTIRLINDPPDPLTWQGIVSLVLIMIGLTVYSRRPSNELEVEDPNLLKSPIIVSTSMRHAHPARIHEFLCSTNNWNLWWKSGIPRVIAQSQKGRYQIGVSSSIVDTFPTASSSRLIDFRGSELLLSIASDDKLKPGDQFCFEVVPGMLLKCEVTECKFPQCVAFTGYAMHKAVKLRYRIVMDGDSIEKQTTVIVETEFTASWWVSMLGILTRDKILEWNRIWVESLKVAAESSWSSNPDDLLKEGSWLHKRTTRQIKTNNIELTEQLF